MIGYDLIDGKIITTIRKTQRTTQEIAQKIGVIRRTVAYRLARMEKVGLVERSRGVQSCHLWRLSTSSAQTRSSVSFYYGKDILRAYALLKKLPKRSIIHSLEGVDYLQRSMKSLPESMVIDIQRGYRRRGNTIKTLVHEKFVEKIPKRLNNLHRNRSVAMGISRSHRSFLGAGLHIITPAIYMIFNEKKKYAIVIKDSDVAGMLYESMRDYYGMLEYTEGVERFDVNKYIEKLIAEKSRKTD